MPAPTRVTSVGAGEYTGVAQDSEYENVTGLVAVPRARDGAAPKLIRVHGDYGLRRVRWQAGRNGRPPLIPAQEDLATDKYIHGTVVASLPVPDPMSGAMNWRVSGEYLFLQSVRARKAGTDPLPTGAYPYPLQPQDAIAQTLLVGVTPGTGYSNPLEDLLAGLGTSLVNHNQLYPWPFTALPVQTASGGLIGG